VLSDWRPATADTEAQWAHMDVLPPAWTGPEEAATRTTTLAGATPNQSRPSTAPRWFTGGRAGKRDGAGAVQSPLGMLAEDGDEMERPAPTALPPMPVAMAVAREARAVNIGNARRPASAATGSTNRTTGSVSALRILHQREKLELAVARRTVKLHAHDVVSWRAVEVITTATKSMAGTVEGLATVEQVAASLRLQGGGSGAKSPRAVGDLGEGSRSSAAAAAADWALAVQALAGQLIRAEDSRRREAMARILGPAGKMSIVPMSHIHGDGGKAPAADGRLTELLNKATSSGVRSTTLARPDALPTLALLDAHPASTSPPPPPHAAASVSAARPQAWRHVKSANTGFCSTCEGYIWHVIAADYGYKAANLILAAAATRTSAEEDVHRASTAARAGGHAFTPSQPVASRQGVTVVPRPARPQPADAWLQLLDERQQRWFYYSPTTGVSQWHPPPAGSAVQRVWDDVVG